MNDVEHIFTCLLAIYVSSSGNHILLVVFPYGLSNLVPPLNYNIITLHSIHYFLLELLKYSSESSCLQS